ncbi:hypothetical protein ACEQ8H_001526 [Pleosporales sp. CAS-2024a]
MAAYEIVERDEAGSLTTTYIVSGGGRIDVMKPEQRKSYAQLVLDVFLPAGYPQSVSEDYIRYGYGLGVLVPDLKLTPNVAVKGVGVGDSSASPTAALLLSVLQESMGRIATILFAHRLGTALEPECKMYRLAADVFNDTAMILDCLSPGFPKPLRVLILGFSSVLRSLCGVCAGSAKASLSAHFAKKGNLGELNAAGSVVVSWVSSPIATWSVLTALLSIHLATNYAAVRSVSMRYLNRQRANIVFGSLFHNGLVPSPAEAAQRERIFERDGVLRWVDGTIVGHCTLGVPLQVLLSRMSHDGKRTASSSLQVIDLTDLVRLFAGQRYMLWFSNHEATVVLKEGCTPLDQLKAWAHALLVAQEQRDDGPPHQLKDDASLKLGRLDTIKRTLEEVDQVFVKYTGLLEQSGWDVNTAALETRGGARSQVDGSGGS